MNHGFIPLTKTYQLGADCVQEKPLVYARLPGPISLPFFQLRLLSLPFFIFFFPGIRFNFFRSAPISSEVMVLGTIPVTGDSGYQIATPLLQK